MSEPLRAQDDARASASSVLMPGHGSLNLEQHPYRDRHISRRSFFVTYMHSR